MIIIDKTHTKVINVNSEFESCRFRLVHPTPKPSIGSDPLKEEIYHWRISCSINSRSSGWYTEVVAVYYDEDYDTVLQNFEKVINLVVNGSDKIDFKNL